MAQQMLQGKVVVVGAGAKNLGGLISKTFGADGAAVVVHYNSDATKAAADETVRAVHAAGGDAFAIQGDLTKVPAVVRLFDEAITRYLGWPIYHHRMAPQYTAVSELSFRP